MSTKEPPRLKDPKKKDPANASMVMWERLKKQYAAEDLPVIFSSDNPDDRIGEYRWASKQGKSKETNQSIVLYSGAIREVSRIMAEDDNRQKQRIIQRIVQNSGGHANQELNNLHAKGLLMPKTADEFEENFYKTVLQHELAHHRQRYEIMKTGYDSPAGKEMFGEAPAYEGGEAHGPYFQKHMRSINPRQAEPFGPEHYGIKTKRPPSEYEDFDEGSPRPVGRFGPSVFNPIKAAKPKPLPLPKQDNAFALPPL